jgi:hypothetical protein
MGLISGPMRFAGLLGRGGSEIFGMAKIGEFRFSPTNCNKTFYGKGKTLNFTHSLLPNNYASSQKSSVPGFREANQRVI